MTAAAGGQTVTSFWPVGASTVWVSTQNLTASTPPVVQRSTDSGMHWTPIKQGFSVAFVLDADHVWLGNGSTLLASGDGGRHWQRVGRDPQCAIQFVTPSDGWCSAIEGALGSEPVQLYRTTDGGRTWPLISRTAANGIPPASTPGALPFGCDKYLWFSAPTRGWAMFACNGGQAPLYRSEDAGRTWAPVTVATPPGQADSGSAFSGLPVFAGSDGVVPFTAFRPSETVIYCTTEGGSAWRVVEPPGPPRAWVADIVTPSVWRLIDGTQLLATDDAGRTWTRSRMNHQFGPLGDNSTGYRPIDFVTTQVGYVNDGRLWRTDDGGRTWKRLAVPGT